MTAPGWGDTRDWYWKDEGSGHVPILRYALLTSTAVEITVRNKQSDDIVADHGCPGNEPGKRCPRVTQQVLLVGHCLVRVKAGATPRST